MRVPKAFASPLLAGLVLVRPTSTLQAHGPGWKMEAEGWGGEDGAGVEAGGGREGLAGPFSHLKRDQALS